MPTAMDATPSTPELSIVVVPFGGRRALERCLAALAGQRQVESLEVVVPVDDRLAEEGPLPVVTGSERLARAAGRRTWAELRARGVAASRGRVVALTEAQTTPRDGWAAAALAAHRSPAAAVGGPVDKRRGTALGWALYFCDYARYAPPLAAGPAAELTDCNVSYKRAALDGVAETWAAEFHENTVHAALARRGEGLEVAPEMVVDHARAPRFGEALADRFHFGRLFGATRAVESGGGRRWLLAAAAPLVPALIVGRAARHVARRRRHRRRLLAALPLMALLTALWALGELVGTVTGRPPAALRPAAADGATG